MTSLWMILLVCSSWRGFGFSLFSDIYRKGIPPTNKLHRCRSNSQFAGIVRHSTICHLAAIPSNDHCNKKTEDAVSWLSCKEDSYRLAFKHVPPSNDDGDPIAVLFCNGFRSAMKGGTKAYALEDHCLQKGWEFCAFDYRGHGLSSGTFEDCTLSDWFQDASDILERVLFPGRKRVVLVGSSMGAWISIHLALRYNNNNNNNNNKSGSLNNNTGEGPFLPIAGILGIASGPDFLQDLYSSTKAEQQAEWRASGIAYLPSRYGDPYPIPWSLVQDAAQHWGILPSTKSILPTESAVPKLSVRCPVRLLHGKYDEDISWKKSQELSNLLRIAATESNAMNNSTGSQIVTLTLVEDGDHRLSRPQDIKLLLDTLDELVMGLRNTE